jgi:hypothetical protein
MKGTKKVKTTMTLEVDSVVPSNWCPEWAANHFRTAIDIGIREIKREGQHSVFIHKCESRDMP